MNSFGGAKCPMHMMAAIKSALMNRCMHKVQMVKLAVFHSTSIECPKISKIKLFQSAFGENINYKCIFFFVTKYSKILICVEKNSLLAPLPLL